MIIYSAPLQGFTESEWRNAHSRIFSGIDTYLTPFIRMEKGGETAKSILRNKDIRDTDPINSSVELLVPQLIASEPEEFCQLADYLVEKGYKWIDINFGCPFPMISKHKKGCGILLYPEKVKSMLESIERYPNVDFSIKMRLGYEDRDEWKKILPILNATRLRMITLHPRTGKQQYKGDIDMDSFSGFYNECIHPLVYNGEIKSVEHIAQIEERFPSLHGVMLGRGLLARPSLAWEYKNGVTLPQEELLNKVVQMHNDLYQQYESRLQGEAQLLNKMKCYWEYMEPTIGKKIYKEIKKSVSLQKYLKAVSHLA